MNWDEVKKLQDEFAAAQMSGSVSKISEKNCIQIIQKLQELDLIELLYTADGKQYLTYDQLDKEIKEEVYVNGGRINVAALQDATNVDITRIEPAVDKLVKSDPDLHLIQGELIDNTYIDTICVEINDLLIESGQVAIGELCKRFNLPIDFLLQQLEPRIGTSIQGQLDSFDRGSIFTDAFFARQSAKIQGVFSAITKPTSVATLVGIYGFHDKIFKSALNELIDDGKLAGALSGRGDKMQYVPHLQQRTQERWIKTFYQENSYIEYDVVKRLGIKNPKGHLKKAFPTGVALETCHVSQMIVDNVAGSVDESLSSGELMDVMMLLPSTCSKHDAGALLNSLPVIKRGKTARVLGDSFVCGEDFVSKCAEVFKDIMESKAKEVSQASKKQVTAAKAPSKSAPANVDGDDDTRSRKDKRDARKEKRAKKKGDKQAEADASSGRQNDSEQQWKFLTVEEMQDILSKKFPEFSAEVFDEMAGILHGQLTKRFQVYVKEAFLAGSESTGRKMDRSKLESEYAELYVKARLFQQGAEQFEGQPLEALSKLLLKSFGAALLNLLCMSKAQDEFVEAHFEPSITTEQRAKMLKQFKGSRTELEKLNQLLNSKSIDDFLDPLEDVATESGFVVKRSDKKRDRQVLLGHKYSMLDQLEKEVGPPTVLHLTSALLFQQQTGYMLHAVGRNVPQVVSFLKEHVNPEIHSQLLDYQDAVMASLNSQDATGPSDEQTAKLKLLVQKGGQ